MSLLTPAQLHERRERVFLVLAGLFIGAMAMLNIIGITRFVHIGPLALAVGVLPYPVTFFCTDLISEFYGRKRANFGVWVGLVVNLFVIGTLWVGNMIPSVDPEEQVPWQVLPLDGEVFLPNGDVVSGQVELYTFIFSCTAGAVLASMLAYMAAQFCDVYVFHFWKRLTNGKHLWLRNNGSTLISQMVDSIMVITITFGAAFLRGDKTLKVMLILIGSSYLFKMVAALLDTIPIYIAVHYLKGYLQIDPTQEHVADQEEAETGQ